MSKFHGGPADGRSLTLRRAPVFLRVVIDADGSVDALDQLDDFPASTEALHVYQKTSHPIVVFACRRSKGKGCSHSVDADYEYYANQPSRDECDIRHTKEWREWCQAEGKRVVDSSVFDNDYSVRDRPT